jgi:hypothetical protein
MEFKELYSLFESYLQKKITPTRAFRAFAGTYFMTLQIPEVSMDLCYFLIFAIKQFTSFGR